MNPARKEENWSAEDVQLATESADIIELLHDHHLTPQIPASLDRDIRTLARTRTSPDMLTNWLIGQGPWVILVTAILFAVALMFLAFA